MGKQKLWFEHSILPPPPPPLLLSTFPFYPSPLPFTAVYFQFVSPTFEVDEGAPFPLINICVELNEADVPTEDAIWISFDTQDDTAISKLL